MSKYYEQQAVQYLENKDYKIIGRNIRFKKIEVDIIAEKNNEIIIVEVKYRTNMNFLQIKPKQKENLDNFIYYFYSDREVRFDLIIFHQEECIHIENAYL